MRTKAKASIIAGLAVLVLVVAGGLLMARGPADGSGAPGPGQMPPPMVEVATARRGRVEVSVPAVGTIEAAERIDVTAQVTGKVTAIHFTEGQWVEAGQVLVALDAEGQEAALDVARAELNDATRQLRRFQGLESGVAVSPAQIDEAEARVATARARVAEAEAALDDQRITAPFAGEVGLREVSPGALIQPGTPITTLATTHDLKVRFELPSELLWQLEPGLPIQIEASGADRRFAGRVARIDSTVDPVTRSVALEGTLEAPGEGLKPGIFVAVETVVEVRPNAILVPEEALVAEAGNNYVYVIGEDRVAERRPVTLGVRRPGEAEIREGLEAGEQVVTRGVQTVQAGRPVQLASAPRGGPPSEAR